MTEKEIMYFITMFSRSIEGKMTFQWPALPDPQMGEEFVNEIKVQFAVVEKWIKENPDKFNLAQRGYYK